MNIQDVVKLKQKIERALENDASMALSLLKQLESFHPTTESLKQTRIGVFVTELRKHPKATEDIKNQSRELVQLWKKQVKPGVDTTLKKEGSDSSLNSAQERNVTTDNVVFTSTMSRIRDKCIEMLYSAIATGNSQSSKRIIAIALAVESTVHKDHPEENKYKSKVRSLVSNLKDKGNPELRQQLASGSIDPETFARMSKEEMMSKERKQQVEQALKEVMLDAVSATAHHAETDMFKCGKCGARKATYYQMQTRSADEPMTTFVTCVACGNRWKFC
ncbi:transcription factor S-II, central domain-containing protein [Gorgonomyces haynaldii]|nr:transcription factor S-II, central domain-containing protein [Gorgonomyces haynaldii]